MKRLPVIPFTKDGYAKIQQEYEIVLHNRKDAVLQLQKAREMGDLSENGFYKAAKANLSSIDHNLQRLKYLIRFGNVRDSTPKNVIDIGTVIVINDGTKEREFTIVGGQESDPLNGKISYLSPIGKALIGKKVGDEVIITIPSGKKMYKVLKLLS